MKLFWYEVFVHLKLKLLDILLDFILIVMSVTASQLLALIRLQCPIFSLDLFADERQVSQHSSAKVTVVKAWMIVSHSFLYSCIHL